MDSVDKLRECGVVVVEFGSEHVDINAIADEIEAEIERDYMKLPLDADGAPIRVGDVIQFVNEQGGTGAKVEVCAISEHYAYYGEGKHFYKASMCRHYHPQTVEDVLREYGRKVMEYHDYSGCMADAPSDPTAEYADKLREVLRDE